MIFMNFDMLNSVYNFNFINTIILSTCSFHFVFLQTKCDTLSLHYFFCLIAQNNFIIIDLEFFEEIFWKIIKTYSMLSQVITFKRFSLAFKAVKKI